MVCKKCGKEFNADNSICPFCNNDNNVNDSSSTETNKPVVEEIESLIEPTPEAQPEIEVLLEPAKPAPVAEPEVEVLLEPAKTEQTPVETPEVENLIEPKSEPDTPITTEVVTQPAPENQTVAPVELTENTTHTQTPETTIELASDASTSTENDEELEEKKKIEPKTIIILVIIIVLSVIAISMYWPKNDEKTNAGNNNTNNNTVPGDIYIEDDLGLTKNWSGLYRNDNFEVKITEDDGIMAEISIISIKEDISYSYRDYFMDYTEDRLYKRDDLTELGYELTITKTLDGIEIKVVTPEPTLGINQIAGTYTKVK